MSNIGTVTPIADARKPMDSHWPTRCEFTDAEGALCRELMTTRIRQGPDAIYLCDDHLSPFKSLLKANTDRLKP